MSQASTVACSHILYVLGACVVARFTSRATAPCARDTMLNPSLKHNSNRTWHRAHIQVPASTAQFTPSTI